MLFANTIFRLMGPILVGSGHPFGEGTEAFPSQYSQHIHPGKQKIKSYLDLRPLELFCLFRRVGSDIRRCRIILPDIRLSAIKSRISGKIRQGMPDNLAGYPASSEKNHIRPNPSIFNVQRFYGQKS